MIETQHKKIPWRWVILLQILGQMRILGFFASGIMTFSMRKFIESPVIINSVSSLDIAFNILIAAPCLYYSDRIWTRFGRRLPFILTAYVVLAIVMILLPLAGSAIPLGLLVVIWLMFWDVGETYQMLTMEIIPPQQRGRAAAINSWLFGLVAIISSLVIVGRFDDVLHSTVATLRGEVLIYWFCAACIIFCILFLALFVKERKPLDYSPPPPGGLKSALTNIFAERTLWPVYMLVFSMVLMETGLGAIQPLLFVDQWGYSKQDMGTNNFMGGIILLTCVIPVIGIFAELPTLAR